MRFEAGNARVAFETGSIELVVFPKIYADSRNQWIDNRPLLISGKVDTRNDEPSLLVDRIVSKDELEDMKDKLFIKIPINTSERSIKNLKKLLLDNPGDQKVILIFEGYEKQLELTIQIHWNQDLAGKITTVLRASGEMD